MSDSNENATKDQPVTITAPPKQVEIDPQNPLPEPSFFWRRWIAIVVTAVSLFFIWNILEALHDLGHADNLLTLAQWVIVFSGLILTYYFIAPSAAELTSMIQSASIIKKSLTLADDGSKKPAGGPETASVARFPPAGTPDSHFSEDEPDAAPRGRS